jgi:hypothetical protein
LENDTLKPNPSVTGTYSKKGERYRSICGRDLNVKATVALTAMPFPPPPPPPPPKRPTGIIIISVLWCLGGLWNLYAGITGINTDLEVLTLIQEGYSAEIQNWASWAIPVEIALLAVVLVLGIMQFATIYGFLKRKSWSYKSGIGVPLIAVITNWSDVFLLYTAPVSLQPSLILPIASIFGAIIYVAYLRQAHVKQWLNVSL